MRFLLIRDLVAWFALWWDQSSPVVSETDFFETLGGGTPPAGSEDGFGEHVDTFTSLLSPTAVSASASALHAAAASATSAASALAASASAAAAAAASAAPAVYQPPALVYAPDASGPVSTEAAAALEASIRPALLVGDFEKVRACCVCFCPLRRLCLFVAAGISMEVNVYHRLQSH